MAAVPLPPPAFYVCPGERHGVSRSVHWGRLAAGYEKCRQCEHRHDTGLVPLRPAQATPPTATSALQFTADGVRGRYLNDLDRARAGAWGAAVAAWLWDRRPLAGRLADGAEDAEGGALQSAPAVIVGFDERPTAPDIAVGVVTALRQMGCRVIDIGLATRPICRFAMKRIAADAGVFVTGAGCDTSWTGLDLFADTTLEALKPYLQAPPMRPLRSAGAVETHAVFEEYAVSLPAYFHALRPLTVVCVTPLETLRFLLPRLFQHLPCRLICLPWPRQRRTATPAGGERMSEAVREHKADLGFLIEEDGQTCGVWDERGQFTPSERWQPWLEGTPAALDAFALYEDGVAMLGVLLQALSLSDAPLSERLSTVCSPGPFARGS